ncbi:MAG: ABC transporter permease, partial [Actinomycetota bacterium]
MLSFITRRTLLAIPVLIGIVVVVFFLIRAIPGDPCTAMLGERATEEACDRFNAANGLDDPVWTQLTIYMKNIFTFNLGESVRFSRPVGQLLIEKLPLTAELAWSALLLAVLGGIPLGIIAARKHNTMIDAATMAFANIGVSMPVFWLG